MKHLAYLFLPLLFIMVSFPALSRAETSPLTITEMAVTTKVVKGNPIDSVHRISSKSVKALYCFTRILNQSGEDTVIKHIWYRDGQAVRESELPVKGEKWRTYSKREVDADSAGNWRVDAVDRNGNVLKSVEFRMN